MKKFAILLFAIKKSISTGITTCLTKDSSTYGLSSGGTSFDDITTLKSSESIGTLIRLTSLMLCTSSSTGFLTGL